MITTTTPTSITYDPNPLQGATFTLMPYEGITVTYNGLIFSNRWEFRLNGLVVATLTIEMDWAVYVTLSGGNIAIEDLPKYALLIGLLYKTAAAVNDEAEAAKAAPPPQASGDVETALMEVLLSGELPINFLTADGLATYHRLERAGFACESWDAFVPTGMASLTFDGLDELKYRRPELTDAVDARIAKLFEAYDRRNGNA